ncbi:hypothetical protein VB713_01310 [Anabaena cylindrica UHCC 0172]|uniref:hypothetical protein n=1 Tax=Anabaena cylindrica TaxID=1165 RepID=UPI002B220C5E|nr:hypothetical protein [Anabaena cylindrica]MEA5549629.1 hypothetical protein [Anabaena cylindrica UHCC 0172]
MANIVNFCQMFCRDVGAIAKLTEGIAVWELRECDSVSTDLSVRCLGSLRGAIAFGKFEGCDRYTI